MRRTESLLSISFLLILAAALIACGDNEPDDNASAGDADTDRVEVRIPQYDTTYDPNNEEAFEAMIFKQHAHLMARVPKAAVDSVMNATLLKAKDMRAGKAAADKGMKDLMARQDTLVRAMIAKEYGISLDSIEAIMREEKEERDM